MLSERYRQGDEGVSLIEVVVAFTILLIALIPLSYLFTTSLVQAGQSTNQQTALSIAEGWAETLSSTTPPVNPASGAVIVDTAEPPAGPAPTFSATVTGASVGKALNTVPSINVSSTTNFAAIVGGVPQLADVTTGSGATAVVVPVSYNAITAGTPGVLTCTTNPCSTSTGSMSGAITQSLISKTAEIRGGTTYALSSKYEWETVQNTGVVSTTFSGGSNLGLPASTIAVSSVTNFAPATVASPQSAIVTTISNGVQSVFYTGIQTSPSPALTGVTGGTGTIAPGARVKQNPKPNLCTSGTPQLLKLTVSVSWGSNADANSVQDSVMINYPPFGVQTLGFIALQVSGDSTATDSQGNPWSERVTAIPVQINGPQVLSLYPDPYGCVFAQVKPGTYTVSMGQPSNNVPPGSSYGSPVFVANAAGGASLPAGSYSGHVWSAPTTVPQGTVPALTVAVGAVTRVQAIAAANYPPYDQGSIVNLSYPTSTAVEDGVSCPGAAQITCVATGQNGSGTAQISWANGSTWSTAALPGGVALTRVTSTSCAGTAACLEVGYGANGAVILHGSTGASPTLTAYNMAGLTGLNAAGATLTQVACPTASQCVAIGTTSAGVGIVLSGTIGTSAATDVWVSDPLSTATTSLTGLQCPVSANGCVAIGTTATTPVVFSGPTGSGTWVPWTTPASGATSFTVSALTQVVCPTSTTCMAIGTGKVNGAATASPVVLSGLAGGSGLAAAVPWIADTLTSTTVTSLSSITCPLPAKCLVAGTGTSGATTGALLLYGPTAGPLQSEFPLNSATTVTAISQVVCPSTTACAAIGNQAGTPVLFTLAVNATANTADTWHSDTVPNGGGAVSSLNTVVCPASAACLIAATGTSGGSPAGFLVKTGNLGGTTTTWAAAGLPAADAVLYFDGISCTSGTSGTCAAVGATPTGAVVLTSSSGPTGGWSDVTPAGLSGYSAQGVPIEINNSALNSGLTATQSFVNAVTAGAATNVTQLPLVFPFSAGYNVFAGDCSSEANTYNVAQAATIPGGVSGTTSGMAVPTVPLGVLSVQVNAPTTGLAHSGVGLTLTSTAAAPCGSDTYTLQSTAADGLSRTQVPYGAYTLKVGATSYGTVVVTGNSVVLSGASSGNGFYVLPAPIAVSA